MASFRILLPLLLLGLIEVKATEVRGLSYFDALTIAMSYFNGKSEEKNAYWISAIEPQLKWDDKSKEPHYMGFTIQETECLKTETRTPSRCDLKKDGKEKYCQAAVKFIRDGEAEVSIHCSPVASNTMIKRTKRGISKFPKIPKFLTKIIKGIFTHAISEGVTQIAEAVHEAKKDKKVTKAPGRN
ncbi:antibacterial peptide PMAP-36-like [Gracilinanus agilis]|uniref:antibacterial peptide PMAP-36-like n=1 Tax=Gracilinanus agilis TaxID=191870 RepID=UPI001CFED0E3|nr:antibacterial peptide PMAP-36-like [Gracilinanus agilis]